MDLVNKKILIVGHPRSGTGYITSLFQELGYSIGHEVMGKDGTCNWTYVIPDDLCFEWSGFPRNKFKFESIYRSIRDPFKAIPSVAFTETCFNKALSELGWVNVIRSTEFRSKHLKLPTFNISKFEHAARSYISWNKMIDDTMEIKGFIRIERALEDLKNYMDVPDSINSPKKDVNSRSHSTMTKSNWKSIPSKYLKQLEKFCLKYDYPSLIDRIERLD